MDDCIPLILLQLLVFQDVQDRVLVDGRMVWVNGTSGSHYKIKDIIIYKILVGAS